MSWFISCLVDPDLEPSPALAQQPLWPSVTQFCQLLLSSMPQIAFPQCLLPQQQLWTSHLRRTVLYKQHCREGFVEGSYSVLPIVLLGYRSILGFCYCCFVQPYLDTKLYLLLTVAVVAFYWVFLLLFLVAYFRLSLACAGTDTDSSSMNFWETDCFYNVTLCCGSFLFHYGQNRFQLLRFGPKGFWCILSFVTKLRLFL